MLSVSEAQQAILSKIKRLEPETVLLLETQGRVLAEAIIAETALPPFDNSAMDGYAVRAEDLISAAPDHPVRLPVIADVPAGHPTSVEITAGTAARITTGAMLPRGADTVVPVEDTDDGARGASELLQSVSIYTALPRGAHVRTAGDDVQRGDQVLSAGVLIRPAEIALLSAVGYSRVKVYRRPRVAVLATGDELVEPNQQPAAGQIRNVNGYSTAAMVMRYGGVPLLLGIARDRTEEVAAKLEEAIGQGADLIVASAGVSVGAYDVVKDAVQAHGSIDLWKVRMRPGKPIAFGAYRQVPFFGLPGNPVSALMTFEQFVRPALRIMCGFTHWKKPTVPVTLREAIESDGRETYARAWVERHAGQWMARLSGGQGSNMLHSLTRANALVIVPDGITHLDAGATAQAQMLDWPEEIEVQ
ncbi:MAG TPA: gephyrin-like molybdotransferase Glp [Anaerolineae bacterium]|nr:gephyrin-like molybdotransferase Glp [Anaerolineae bacterium]